MTVPGVPPVVSLDPQERRPIWNPPYRYEPSEHGPVTIYDAIDVGWIARVKESLPHKEQLAAAMVDGLNAAATQNVPSVSSQEDVPTRTSEPPTGQSVADLLRCLEVADNKTRELEKRIEAVERTIDYDYVIMPNSEFVVPIATLRRALGPVLPSDSKEAAEPSTTAAPPALGGLGKEAE